MRNRPACWSRLQQLPPQQLQRLELGSGQLHGLCVGAAPSGELTAFACEGARHAIHVLSVQPEPEAEAGGGEEVADGGDEGSKLDC